MESFLTIVRSKTSTFRLFEVTFLLEKWKLVCLISTFLVPRRSKSGWRKQDSVERRALLFFLWPSVCLVANTYDFQTRNLFVRPFVVQVILDFILQVREYLCNITRDIFFDIPRKLLEQK